MSRFLKLVNFELGRFMKIYLVLMGFTIVVQVTGVTIKAKGYLANANEAINEQFISRAEFLERTGPMSFLDYTGTLWFMAPIAICAAALIFYVFLIWYRDWFGKNTFAYRLLMLPTARLNVYLAKATSIFLMVLGLVSLQLILLPLENSILMWMLPGDFQADLTVSTIVYNFPYLSMLLPQSFIQFVLYYGAGLMAVFVVFTAILFERSFRWKGILMGVGYGILAFIIFISPLLLLELLDMYYLYPLEMIGAEVVLGLIVIAMSLSISNYLLTKKITV